MPLILSGNVASATADAGYTVANSCRFNSADSAYLKRTQGTPTSDQIGTISFWFKRSSLGDSVLYNNYVSGVPQEEFCYLDFRSDDEIRFACDDPGTFDRTPQDRHFRDQSAWYHFVGTIDTTQGVEADRIKLYINGEQITSTWRYAVMPSQNDTINLFTASAADQNKIGVHYNGSGYYNYFNGYMSEFVYCDGQAYAASSFGEFDEDSPTIWKPKDVSGLTFGDEGFYLSFSDSADLGADSSGNSNDFTAVNLDATDQATDTPTNNFATLNPLDGTSTGTAFVLSEGNCKGVTAVDTGGACQSTLAVSSGKWYAEFKIAKVGDNKAGGRTTVGIGSRTNAQVSGNYYGNTASPIDSYGKYSASAHYYSNNGSLTSYGSSFVDDDIIGVYLDLDNNKLYFSENGALYSTTGIDITAAASTFNGHYHIGASDVSANDNGEYLANYGGCPAFAISSGNADDNGYGNFEYSPNITGDSVAKKFYALCTKNLAEFG